MSSHLHFGHLALGLNARMALPAQGRPHGKRLPCVPAFMLSPVPLLGGLLIGGEVNRPTLTHDGVGLAASNQGSREAAAYGLVGDVAGRWRAISLMQTSLA